MLFSKRTPPEREDETWQRELCLTSERLEDPEMKPAGIICTGLYHRYVKPSPEWTELLTKARENERAIQERFPAAEEQLRAGCRQLARDNPALPEDLASEKKMDAFCSSVLSLRGPLQQGPLRGLAREQMRLLGFLSSGVTMPGSADEILDLWEWANALEPRMYDELPAHFRTAADHVPFTGFFTGTEEGKVRPGMETAAPEEIPELVARLLDWINRPELSPELAAFTAHHLFVCIHPFSDGNGHAARLLSCALLSRVYSAPTLTAFLRQMWMHQSLTDKSILEDKARDGGMDPACVHLLGLLVRGQEQVLACETGNGV